MSALEETGRMDQEGILSLVFIIILTFTDTQNLAEAWGYFIFPVVSANITQTSTTF